MKQQELKILLQDYVATANDPKVGGDWNKIDSLFPELANVDKGFLRDYVATANDPKVSGDWDKINSLFPETGIKPEDPKTKIFSEIKDIDLKRSGDEEGTFYDKLLFAEKNAVANLRKHYDTDNNDIIIEEGVAPDNIWGNWLPEIGDNVYIKNEAGEEKVFRLPTAWNASANIVPGAGFFASEAKGSQRSWDWSETIKEINDFINEGRRNKDPNYISEKKSMTSEVSELLNNNDFLTEAIGTDAQNWKHIAANDDNDKKDLTKKIKEKFGEEWLFWFNAKDEYGSLNEFDIEKAVDKAIDTKLHAYNNELESAKVNARRDILDIKQTDLFQFGKQREKDAVKNMTEDQKEVVVAFNTLKNLLDDENADPTALKQAHANLVEKRQKLATTFTSEEALVDMNGHTISDLTQVESGGYTFSKEELDTKENELSTTFKDSGSYLDGLEHASNINFVDLEINAQEGEEYFDIVINDPSAYIALGKLGYSAKDKTKNGFVFRVKKKHLGGSYNHLVRGDGFDFYHDFLAAPRKGAPGYLPSDEDMGESYGDISDLHDAAGFKSRDGYFGLLEFDDEQSFDNNTRFFNDFWDQDEYEENNSDLSKAFKRSLKDWQEDNRRLAKDRTLLNKMFLLNSDPGSNEKTWDLGVTKTKAPAFVKKHVFDPVHRMGEVLGEGFSHAGGFDIDPFMSSKRSINDALETMSYNTGLGLTDDQKDRMHRTGAYKVLEGVAGFVPAIVEFALIDVALKKVGAITGIPRLIDNMAKVHKVGGKTLTRAQLSKYADDFSAVSTANPTGKTVKIGDDLFNSQFAKVGGIVEAAPHLSRHHMMHHTYKMLREEGKMAIAFEDDYKIGMGAGFYLAGRFLPRFQSDQYNRLNTALRVGRSGIAGALGVQTASQLEAVIEDLRGSTTFRKHLADNYSDLSEAGQSALVDFFVFSIVGGRGALGKFVSGKGTGVKAFGFTGLTGHQRLRDLTTEINEKITELEKQLEADPKNKDLKTRLEKLIDLRAPVSRQLVDLYKDMDFRNNPEKAAEYLQRTMEGNMRAFGEKNNIKYEALVEFDIETGIGKTKDGREINMGVGNTAKFFRTGEHANTMFFDLAELTTGKPVHEIGHAVYWNVVKNNPELAEWMKSKIKDAFSDALFTIKVKDKETGKTIEKDVNLEEYIEHAYGKEKNFEKISPEEYVTHALEVLSSNGNYAKLVGKGTWNSLKNDMNMLTERYAGFTLFKAGTTKGELMNFFGNFARSAKVGKLTENQVKMFNDIAKREGFAIEGVEADNRTAAQKGKKEVIDDVNEGMKSKKNKMASAKIQEKYDTEVSNLTGSQLDEAVRNMTKPDPKNPKTSVAGKDWDSIIYDVVKMYPKLAEGQKIPGTAITPEQYSLASELVFHLNRGPNEKGRGLPDIIKAYKNRKSWIESVKDSETGKKKDQFVIFDKFGDKKLKPKEIKELEEKWDAEAGTQEFINRAIAEGYKGKQNLTKTVMQTLALRVHKMKQKTIDKQSEVEYEMGFRRDIDDYQDVIKDKGPSAEDLYDFRQAKRELEKQKPKEVELDGKKFKIQPEGVYTREGVNIREILGISEAGVNRIREINTKTLLKTKPKDATFGKLGKKTLKETTEVLKKWMGREEGVAKKEYYEKQKERIEEYNDRLYTAITLTSHPKFYENSQVGKTIFSKYFKQKIDKNGNKEYFLFTEMPMEMTAKEKAAGPVKWEKEKLENLPEKDLAKLIYSGRKDTHEKKVNELIAKIAVPLSKGILREQLNNPELQRQLKEKNRELYESLKFQDAIEKLRGATPEGVAAKKTVIKDDLIPRKNAKAIEALNAIDDLIKEYPKRIDFERSLDIEGDLKKMVNSREDWKEYIGPHLPKLNKLLGTKLVGEALEVFRKVAQSQRMLGTLVGKVVKPIIFKGKFKHNFETSINKEVQKLFLEELGKQGRTIEDLSPEEAFWYENINRSFKSKLNDKKTLDYYINEYIPELLKDMPSELVKTGLLKNSLFFTGKYKIDPKLAKELGIPLTKSGLIEKGLANKIIEENPGIDVKILDNDGQVIELKKARSVDNGTLKENLIVEYKSGNWNNRHTDTNVLQKLADHIRDKYLKAKDAKTYEETIDTNERLQEYIFTKIFEHYAKSENKLKAANGILLLLQAQTNIGGGFVRSLATHTGISLKLEDMYRSEHPFQALHFSGNAVINMMKNSGSKEEFLKNYRPLARIFKQTIIPESLREKVDGVENGGNIGNILENIKEGTDIMSEANFLYDIATMSTILNLRTKKTYDGFLGEVVGGAEGLKFLKQARKNLAESVNPIVGSVASKKLNLIELNETARLIEKAKRFGLTVNKERRGMSTWDFDDTLAMTKSGVRAKIPNPKGDPKPGKKVIFLAGGAGSGKSNVVKQLGLEKQGFKVVNQDISLEWLKKNHGLPENMKDLTKEQLSKLGKLQWEARRIAARKQMKFKGRGDGIVVDGTGGSMKVMEKQVKEFRDKGYDVQMMFVETSLETALKRNAARKERTLRESIVIKNHEAVQNNKEGFRKLFGDNFAEVKTDNLKVNDPMPKELVTKMDKFTKSYENRRLTAEEFAMEGKDILDKGGEFDFKEFDVVTKGEKGPFFQKALDRAKKYGTKDQFVLTARPPEAQVPIYEFLKSQGLEIPLKNITALGNSTAQAKAMWMLKKASEGYNDFYFADDALPNVREVKKVLDQLDVKSDVQQAMASKKAKLKDEFRNIMKESKGIPPGKAFSAAEAKEAGKGYKFFVAPSIMDLRQLLKPLLSKGELGIAQEKWFRKEFLLPYGRGINDFNIAKNQATQDYHALLKAFPEVRKKLKQKIPGSFITYENAIRLHRWKEAGIDMTKHGLSKVDFDMAVETVRKNPKLLGFSRGLGLVSKQTEGYVKPTENWVMENISTDLYRITDKANLKKYLADWVERKNEIFSEENLNMLERELGTNYREALEDVLWRMENNSNRNFGSSKHAHTLRNINNATVAGVMFFNIRSATLQLISTVNYLNYGDNNIFKAGARMLDLPQFTKDFVEIWNSDMMVQRRRGLKFDIAQQEIMEAIRFSPNKATAALRWMLEKGYIPTKYADNFAIAFGGASYLRNRINTYKKQGMSEKDANEKAWEDFTEITQERQQSSRPDFISQQQAGVVGSIILNWGNTPIQMFRVQHKEIGDLAAGRFDSWTKGENSAVAKLSKIMYYGAIQSAMFYSLQTALLAVLDSPDEDKVKEKEIRTLNGMLDSYLMGFGITGKGVSTVKNTIMEYIKQNEKEYNVDHAYTVLQALNFSPPISVKARKLYSATQTMKFNKDEIKEKGFSLDNPALDAAGKMVSVTTNAPLDRVVTKLNNIDMAVNGDLDAWQRMWLMLGWNKYNLDINDPNINRNKKKDKKKKVPYATY